MTFFKICGIRDVETAKVAAEAGATFLGMVFVPGVRRQIAVEQGQEIAQALRNAYADGKPKLVGLFADQPIEDVNRIVAACGLDFAQLCGDEGPVYWQEVETNVIRQIKVRDGGDLIDTVSRTLNLVTEVASYDYLPLLDSYRKGALGGTGHRFDWRVAEEVGSRFQIVLAGGLTPENVLEAIRIAHPWAVDVSSGVEVEGQKAPARIRAFAEGVNSAGHDQTGSFRLVDGRHGGIRRIGDPVGDL